MFKRFEKNESKKDIKPIVAVTYKYKNTGQLNEKGYPIYEKLGKQEKVTKHTSYSHIKQEAYEKSKSNKDIFVNYGKKPINSVTVRNGDTKAVTYFKRVK